MPSSFEGSEIFIASPERILSLINNFESYKEFLPGCLESSRLPDAEEDFVMGRLVFSVLNKTYAFESNNKTDGYKVGITQSKGPFLDFHALWSLEAIDENQTKVRFKTTFTLPFALSIIATQSVIDKIGHKFIRAFATQLVK
jgi:ribosome-associated toxin RatA of RatAB toxin-antitoxin module